MNVTPPGPVLVIVKVWLPVLLIAPPFPDVALLPEKVALPDISTAAFVVEIAPPLGAVLLSKETAEPLAPIATVPLLVTPMALPLCDVLMFENVTVPVMGIFTPVSVLPEIAEALLPPASVTF